MNVSSPTPSVFDFDRIREESFVLQIDFHEQIDSTNNRALELARQPDVITPLLVLTEDQTGGRGRGSNRWWSATGSLTFSLLLDPGRLPQQQVSLISLTVGLAVCQAVERFAPMAQVGLKWPNDIYVNGRKLAGILIELPSRRPPRVVVGVGINVNNSVLDSPAEVAVRGTSLRECLQQELDLNDVLLTCLQEIERRWQELEESPEELADQWQAYHILQGRHVELNAYSRWLRGTCLGIDREGALLLETEHGLERCLGGVVEQFE